MKSYAQPGSMCLVTRKSAGITRGIARVRYHQMLCNLRENRRNATKAVSPLNLGRRSTGTCFCFRQSQLSQLIFCRIFSRNVVLLHCSLHGSSVEVTRLIDDAQQQENLQAIHALHGRWIWRLGVRRTIWKTTFRPSRLPTWHEALGKD